MRRRRHWHPGDPRKSELLVRSLRLGISAESPVRTGLGGVLRQRVADAAGLDITGILIAIEGSKGVLADRNGQPTPGIRQSVGVHQLVILTHIPRLIVGWSDQTEPGL
jgi:hypothetical protein